MFILIILIRGLTAPFEFNLYGRALPGHNSCLYSCNIGLSCFSEQLFYIHVRVIFWTYGTEVRKASVI
jgi:hypothetical protein